ncbi:MAG: 4-hydroxy-3-methylbut-2-en-yl diphosphate reductase [Thermotogaceae bacterium]|jgi:4-hydroxy-3-methylbut-2-enyl diphosphate reductase|nr:4-hydroxy-3-methylbut-2-en-yl diphosphate reductase [Thermotogaceae bacterium]MDN5338226.1 4-hydroxy-3-methylbut-2-en-yl diphosphate reductase [Thermotogaceae bacterium]
MKLIIANNIGFCFGVKRSVDITEKILHDNRAVAYVTGDLVHNEKVMDDLKKKGLKIFDPSEKKLINIRKNSVIIIRAHGLPPKETEYLKNTFESVVDTTCPIVSKMFETAESLVSEGRKLFVLGNKEHPEMIALNGHVREAIIFSDIRELEEFLNKEQLDKNTKIALISQTTKDLRTFCEAAYTLTKNFKDLRIVKTICDFTVEREHEVEELAKKSELVIVVGSSKSSNTRKLFNIARKFTNTILISNTEQLDDSLKNFKTISIVSGTSTPNNLIEEIVGFIKNKFGEVEVSWRGQI